MGTEIASIIKIGHVTRALGGPEEQAEAWVIRLKQSRTPSLEQLKLDLTPRTASDGDRLLLKLKDFPATTDTRSHELN